MHVNLLHGLMFIQSTEEEANVHIWRPKKVMQQFSVTAFRASIKNKPPQRKVPPAVIPKLQTMRFFPPLSRITWIKK